MKTAAEKNYKAFYNWTRMSPQAFNYLANRLKNNRLVIKKVTRMRRPISIGTSQQCTSLNYNIICSFFHTYRRTISHYLAFLCYRRQPTYNSCWLLHRPFNCLPNSCRYWKSNLSGVGTRIFKSTRRSWVANYRYWLLENVELPKLCWGYWWETCCHASDIEFRFRIFQL